MNLIKTNKTSNFSQRVNLDNVLTIYKYDDTHRVEQDHIPIYVISFRFDHSNKSPTVLWEFENEADRDFVLGKIDNYTVEL